VDLPVTAAIRESELQVGQRVVYPNQGVCRISGIETKEIGGVRAEFLTMKREEDGATVMVPRSKLASIGLRHVAQPNEVQAILAFFEAESGDPELDWKVRHRTHAEKMTDGSLTGTAEVLKALHSLSERRPLPQKERELYDSARHLVVNEVSVALSIANGTAEDVIDFCLTPPVGSPRAQHKARLKADREAAEEAALLDGLEDLGDLSDVVAGAEEELESPTPSPKADPPTAKVKKAAPPAPAKRAKPEVKGTPAKPKKGAKIAAAAKPRPKKATPTKRPAPKPAPKAKPAQKAGATGKKAKVK
jgi:CarD family transcriptional regulator